MTSIDGLLSLDGKAALVTGAATGIGEGIARVLAAAGAEVVIGDINLDGARGVAESIVGQGGRAHAVHLDVTDSRSADSVIERMVELTDGIDVLVNNAGSYFEGGSIIDQTLESWQHAVAVNFASVFHCCKPAAIRMVEQERGGAIVNVSSVDAWLPSLGTGYDSAKAAVVQLTRTLAVDLSPHRIRVNGIAPGLIEVQTFERVRNGELPPIWPGSSRPTGLRRTLATLRDEHIPLGGAGRPEDIGRAALFLASEASSYVTGQNLIVDGGYTLI